MCYTGPQPYNVCSHNFKVIFILRAKGIFMFICIYLSHFFKCRFGNMGSLSVRRLSDIVHEDLAVVSGMSPSTHSQFELSSQAHLFIGGVPDDYQV